MKTQKGFSLIEILFVVVIMAVLVAIAITQYQTAVDKSRFTALIPTAKALANAQEIYHLHHGGYTNDMSRLDVNMEGASGDQAVLSSGAIVEIGLDDEYRYVKATRDNLDNNYIMYQSHSQNYPGEIHCEALEGSSRAEKVCKNMGGREISGNLTEGYTTYILRGEGNGIPASFAHEMGEGNFQTCESYPCSKVCARNLPDNYECQGTYNEDHSYSEQVCNNGMCVTTSYDSNGKATSKSLCKQDEEAGICKELIRKIYDKNGNLLENRRSCVDYDENGSCKFFRSAIINTYDEQGNLVSTQAFSLNSWEVYDRDGRIISSAQYGSGKSISTGTYVYDENGRLISKTNQYGSVVSYTYDENGRIATRTQHGSTVDFVYDENTGLLMAEVNQTTGGTFASYTYDENGRLESSTDIFGNVTNYVYDENGRLIAETNRWGTSATYTYDEDGRLISLVNQVGCHINYSYNEDGGYVAGITPNSTTTYNTYEDGHLASSTTTNTSTWSSNRTVAVYDEEGYLVSSTYQYSSRVDGNNVWIDSGTSTYTYGENGKVSSLSQYGSTTTYSYDSNGNLTSQIATSPNGSTYSYSYTYDEDGNMTSQTYRYGTTGTPSTTTYTYDENGNMTSSTSRYGNGTPSTTTYTYNEEGKLTTNTSSSGWAYTYVYDDNGNLTSYNYVNPQGNITWSTTYTYDEGGSLISSHNQSQYGSSTSYYLDGDASPVINQAGCVTIQYATGGNIGSFYSVY